MILNEDFFNDIEIKDEDLTVEDPYLNVKEYNEKTSRELLEHKMSKSEMVLMIHIYTDKFHGQFNIWHRIERIMKRLKYMFSIYNINLSEPFLMRKNDSFEILKNKKFPDKKDNYILIQHKGCNLYFPKDRLREYGPDGTIKDETLKLIVFLDKKVPVFKTAMRAYNFLIGLDKCIWRDTNFDDGCFSWYYLYNMNDVYIAPELTRSCFDNNSYVNDYATRIYQSILHLVPKELAELLMKKRKLLQLSYNLLKTLDVKNIIRLAEQ